MSRRIDLGVGIRRWRLRGPFSHSVFRGRVRNADVLGIVSRTDTDCRAKPRPCAHELGRGQGEGLTSHDRRDGRRSGASTPFGSAPPTSHASTVMEEIVDTIEVGSGASLDRRLRARSRSDGTPPKSRRMLGARQAASASSTVTSRISCSPLAWCAATNIVWARGAALTGPPYLARAAEEHSGSAHAVVLGRQPSGWRRAQRHDVPLGRGGPLPPHALPESLERCPDTCEGDGSHELPEVAATDGTRRSLADMSDGKLDYAESPGRGLCARAVVEYRDGRRQSAHRRSHVLPGVTSALASG